MALNQKSCFWISQQGHVAMIFDFFFRLSEIFIPIRVPKLRYFLLPKRTVHLGLWVAKWDSLSGISWGRKLKQQHLEFTGRLYYFMKFPWNSFRVKTHTASQEAVWGGYSICQNLRNECDKVDRGIIRKPWEQGFRISKAELPEEFWSNLPAWWNQSLKESACGSTESHRECSSTFEDNLLAGAFSQGLHCSRQQASASHLNLWASLFVRLLTYTLEYQGKSDKKQSLW